MLVAWPKKSAAFVSPTIIGEGALANAHPRYGSVCAEVGHDPLNEPLGGRQGGRIVTVHNVCQRCGVVYAIESYV